MEQFTTVAGALADPSRVRILLALRPGELCACQLTALLQLAPSTVSQHCAILRQAGLIRQRKAGRWIHYRLAGAEASPLVKAAAAWLEQALGRSAVARQDQRALKASCSASSLPAGACPPPAAERQR